MSEERHIIGGSDECETLVLEILQEHNDKIKDLKAKNKQLEELLRESIVLIVLNAYLMVDDPTPLLNKDLIKELIHKGKTWKHINRDDI